MMKCLLASNNQHKKREICEILQGLDIEIVLPREMNMVFDVEETGQTFAENALIKARAGVKLSGLPTIADDSGLCVNALDGRPGVYSARYMGEDAAYTIKMRALIEELAPYADKSAYFESAIAFCSPSGEEFTVRGVCNGVITAVPMGESGFGYDPVFYLPEKGKTFAQLREEEKNEISHRGLAVRALKERLTQMSGEREV